MGRGFMIRTINDVRGSGHRWTELILVSVGICGFLGWYGFPFLTTAADDARMVFAFNYDEALHLRIVGDSLADGSLRIYFRSYGLLYFYSAIIPLSLFAMFHSVSEQHIMLVLRLIPLLSAAGVCLLTYLICARYWGRRAAIASVLLLLTVPGIFRDMSVLSHPDMLQVFFVVFCLYFCCRLEEEWRYSFVFCAAIAAGLAFASKYGGILLLPILWLLVGLWVFGFIKDGGSNVSRLPRCLEKTPLSSSPFLALVFWVGVTTTVFGAVFFVTSPFSFEDWGFIKGIMAESAHMRTGHIFREQASLGDWVAVVTSPAFIGPILAFVFLLGVIFAVVSVRISRFTPHFRFPLTLWIWFAIYLLSVVPFFNVVRARYLLPVLPVIVMIAAVTLVAVADLVAEIFFRTRRREVAASLLILVLIGLCTARLPGIRLERDTAFTREEENAAMVAGRWLEDHFPTTSTVLYDAYSYVPPAFTEAVLTHRSLDYLQEIRPDIVVVNSVVRSWYLDLARADDYRHGRSEFESRYRYYHSLENEETEYRLLKEFDGIKIYTNQ